MLLLIVDDDIEDFEIFVEAINTFDLQTECLHTVDGGAALKLLKKLSVLPDYIFLDINMPIMGGKEFLKKIKSLSRRKNIPVIVYSTTSNSLEIEMYKKLGAEQVVTKPTSYTNLIETLKSILGIFPKILLAFLFVT